MTAERPRDAAQLFGRRVRELRLERNLTQEDLAERAGCSQSHVSTIEWGDRVPHLLMILRLALALESTVTELMRPFDGEDLRSLLAEGRRPRPEGT